jgi:UDP-2-acetamido-3-amino-2,3-dideoxy-glucuronate N-acetyltransferase
VAAATSWGSLPVMARDPSVYVHPTALCESDDVGPRTRIWAFVHVLAGARIGADCNVGDHAYVEGGVVVGDSVTVKNNVLLWDGVTVEDEVFLGPNAVFTNDLRPRAAFRKDPRELLATLVRRGATVGANATVLSGLTIGRWAMVGAGAVVVADVPDHALVLGNPARQAGWACVCGRALPADLACACGRGYRLADGRTLEARSSAPGHDG